MVDAKNRLGDDRPLTLHEFALRAACIGLQLVLVYYLGQQGTLFFYQVF